MSMLILSTILFSLLLIPCMAGNGTAKRDSCTDITPIHSPLFIGWNHTTKANSLMRCQGGRCSGQATLP